MEVQYIGIYIYIYVYLYIRRYVQDGIIHLGSCVCLAAPLVVG